MLYSSCCHAKVAIDGERGALYYVCSSCDNPCDTMELTTNVIQPIKEQNITTWYSSCCHTILEDDNWLSGTTLYRCSTCGTPCHGYSVTGQVVHNEKLLREGYKELAGIEPELTFDSVVSLKEYYKSELYDAKMGLDWLGVLWTRITHWFIEAENTITRFVERGKKGWSRVDVWDLDHYLLDVLIETTERLNATTIRDDVKYKKDLHDISNTLKSVKGMYSSVMGKEASKQCQKQINYAFKLLSKRFMQLWD